MEKNLIGVTATILAVVLVLGVTVYAIWHNEISTIASMKLVRERNDAHLDGAVYTMNVKGDFHLDEFVKQGGEETVATDQNTDKPDFTSTTLLRLILDYADNVEEAVEIASAYDLHDSAKTSYHYMVADASGKSAILEWVNGTDATDNDGSKRELKVTYNDNDAHIGDMEAGTNYQVITNFVIQPGYYDGSPVEDKKGYDRYERIYEELNKTNGIVEDEKAAMDILSIVGRRSWKNDDGNGCTVHSVVYNLTDKTMMWIPNENYDDPDAVFTFSLED